MITLVAILSGVAFLILLGIGWLLDRDGEDGIRTSQGRKLPPRPNPGKRGW